VGSEGKENLFRLPGDAAQGVAKLRVFCVLGLLYAGWFMG